MIPCETCKHGQKSFTNSSFYCGLANTMLPGSEGNTITNYSTQHKARVTYTLTHCDSYVSRTSISNFSEMGLL